MERSKIPLHKWAIAIYMVTTNLKSVSSMKLHRDLGITQKSACSCYTASIKPTRSPLPCWTGRSRLTEPLSMVKSKTGRQSNLPQQAGTYTSY